MSDPRSFRAPNLRHDLIAILVIAVCAVIGGAEGWEDIEDYGYAQAEWFSDVLDLPHGIPSHDPFRRVLCQLDPDELTKCFVSWTTALSDLSGGDIVAIDGKTLRQSLDRATSQSASHMGSAWATANRLVLGQVEVDDKANEITAIPKLLKMLDLSGTTVTIDAMGCQQEIAQVITEQGADYVLALKKNHSTLYDDVKLLLDDAQASGFADLDYAYHETVDGEHGRIETRSYWTTSEIDWLGAKMSWANLQSIGFVESQREIGEKVELERRYYIVSFRADGARFGDAVWQHWGVENGLHWGLDVSFDEDACRIRKDKGAQTFSVLRHIALNMLKREGQNKRGIKARRKRAGWDRNYLLQVLMA